MENCVIGVLRRTRAVRGRRAGGGASWARSVVDPDERNAAQSRPDVGSRGVDLRAGGEDEAVMSVVGGVVLKVF